MTIQDMHMAVKMELDKNVLSNLPSFTDEQIDWAINKGYLRVINQYFTGHNPTQVAFEDNKKRIADLNRLIRVAPAMVANVQSVVANERTFDYSNITDVMIPISCVLYNPNNGITYATEDVNHVDIENFKICNGNFPWIPNPAVIYEGSTIIAYIDAIEVEDFIGNEYAVLRYIKHPSRLHKWIYNPDGSRKINLSGDESQIPAISEHVHYDIVSEAASILIENIESKRIQTQPALNQNRE